MQNLCKVLAMAIGAWCMTFAQEAPPAPVNPRPAAAPATNSPGRVVPRFDRASLELTQEQRVKINEVNKSDSETATPFFARLQTVRRELDALVNQDKFDEAALRAKAKEIAEIEADLAVARATRYSKFRAFLT